MFGRIAWFAAVLSAGLLLLATGALAQDDIEPTPAQPRRPLTLSERLQHFRQDLLGDPAGPNGPRRFKQDDSQPNERRTIIRSGPSYRQPTTRQRNVPIVREVPANQLPAPPPDPPILTPPRMKAQSARRAKAGVGAEAIDTDSAPIEIQEAEPALADPFDAPPTAHRASRATAARRLARRQPGRGADKARAADGPRHARHPRRTREFAPRR